MKVIAIDPGYGRVGIAVMEKKNNKENIIFSECFETMPGDELHFRIAQVGKRVRELIQKHKVTHMAVEDLFFAKNTKTALDVAYARGVIINQALCSDIPVLEYTPNQIKVALTGYGNAKKKDMYTMVEKILGISTDNRVDDEIDAIGVGITFFASYRNI
jgi:crossover junction endodeoxyribonuclease RuvC